MQPLLPAAATAAAPPPPRRRAAPNTLTNFLVVAALFVGLTCYTWSGAWKAPPPSVPASLVTEEASPATRRESTPPSASDGRAAHDRTIAADELARATAGVVAPPSNGRPDREEADGTAAAVEPTATRFPQQCRHLGPKFEAAVRAWLSNPPKKRLIYNCEPQKKGRLCGGMGDRFRGMISVAWLALVLNRRFELYHPYPVPIEEFLAPHWADWRMQETTEEAREKLPLNTQLMRLNLHGKFMRTMGSSGAETDIGDLRVQSNSFGVDPYLHRIPKLSRRVTEELGVSKACNITCYFSCVYGLLFKPTPPLRRSVERTFANVSNEVVWRGGGGAAPGSDGFTLAGVHPFIAVQIRMGGDWAPGLAVKEPPRTPPIAVKHFVSVLKELKTGGAKASPARPDLSEAPIFVTSDSQRLIHAVSDAFAPGTVFTVPGDCFSHTDSAVIGKINPQKWTVAPEAQIRASYLCTLTSHFIVSQGSHVVMAQSGFGDTAFWRSNSEASALFVDMTNLRVGWQHRLSYECRAPATGRDCSDPESPQAKLGGGCGCGAVPSMSRILDLRQGPAPFYGASGKGLVDGGSG